MDKQTNNQYLLRIWGRAATLVLVSGLLAACATAGSKDPTPEDLAKLVERTINAGDEAARRGDFERALTHYLRALETEESLDVWFRVGAASSQVGRSQGALLAYSKVLETDPLHAQAHEGSGLEHLALGDVEAAREHLSTTIALDPDRWRSHNALGILADQTGDYAAAMRHYETALAINPKSPMLLNNIGYSRYLSGDLDQAARDFYNVTRLYPDYEAAWTNLGIVYAQRRWYLDAVGILARVMDKAKAYNDVGYIAYRKGDLAEAERLLAEAVRVSPTYYLDANRNLEQVRARLQGGPRNAAILQMPTGPSPTLAEAAAGDEG